MTTKRQLRSARLLALALACAGCRRDAAPPAAVAATPTAPAASPVAPAESAPPAIAFAEARQLVADCAPVATNRPADRRLEPDWANLNTALRRARHLLERYAESPAVCAKLHEVLGAARVAAAALREGRPAPTRPGRQSEGYLCDIDNSFQPFLRYLPRGAAPGRRLPLVVFLHGYAPDMDIVNWDYFPAGLEAFADEAGFALVAPFGRSNTDYQGIGEVDVLRALDDMRRRYPIDDDRVILAGISMGGMGVWSIGARHPQRFAGLVVISGRGDYYFWHGLKRADVPVYKQALVDTDFGHSMLARLADMPVYGIHGSADTLIPVEEARHIIEAVRATNRRVTYVELEGGDHWIYDQAVQRADLREWMRLRQRANAGPASPPPAALHAVRSALLAPFTFVLASADEDGIRRWRGAVTAWQRYAKALPRVADGRSVTTNALAAGNVFLFGEPETSPLIREVLRHSPVRPEGEWFVAGDHRIPRAGHGLWVARPSPWNRDRLAVVQCGIAWGESAAPNHVFDFLPDFIVYGPEADADGSNHARAAGFFAADGSIDQALLHTAGPPPSDRVGMAESLVPP